MKNFLAWGLPLMAAGLLLAAIPTTILPVCDIRDGMAPMRCHWTGRALSGYGCAIFVLGALLFLGRNAGFRLGVAAAALVVCISAALVPTHFIGTCRSPEMPCNTGTLPGALVVLSLAGLVCLLSIFVLKRRITEVRTSQ
ncbi:MAG: DUF4418 family protein [Planctomycetes bacterium]|nr:DUF4418 family protein [Planctomycetota bacterium]